MNGNNSTSDGTRQSTWRLGVVGFLNSRPLICGLEREPSVKLCFDVPSKLTDRLAGGEFDAALIPVVDLLRADLNLKIVSDSCIGSDGDTLTVRVFSKVPPQKIRRIYLDADSRTSAALVKLVWPDLHGAGVEFVDLPQGMPVEDCEAVLLIGDKVVSMGSNVFRYQVDLGGAWKTMTGLPFVFAVWAAPKGPDYRELQDLLGAARRRGVRRAGQLAVEHGPALGWPVALAQQYLQRYLCFELQDPHVEGMVRFLDLTAQAAAPPGRRELHSIP